MGHRRFHIDTLEDDLKNTGIVSEGRIIELSEAALPEAKALVEKVNSLAKEVKKFNKTYMTSTGENNKIQEAYNALVAFGKFLRTMKGMGKFQ